MDYKDYIDLGFKREDFNDNVEFNRTGYGGFCLTKNLNKHIFVQVNSSELDTPKLFIEKSETETYHIIRIPPESVKDIFRKE